MDILLKEIGRVSVFLICAQLLLQFRAKDSYEKYIKLLISMMLIMLLASPLLTLIGNGDSSTFIDKVYEYEERIQAVMMDAQPKEEEIEVILQNITNEKLKQSVEYTQVTEQEKNKQEQENVVSVDSGQIEIVIEPIEVGGTDG